MSTTGIAPGWLGAWGVALGLAASTVVPRDALAQTPPPPPQVFTACYVPLSGTVYRVGTSDTKPACTSPSHVLFSWTDGANAVHVTDPAGGDLSGVFANASVIKLLGRALATTAPTSGQALVFDGTSWTPTSLPGTTFAPATGDLSGTYPNLTVAGLQGKPVSPAAPTAGQLLSFTGTLWQAVAPPPAGVTAHGALTGLLNDDHTQYLLADGARATTNGFAVMGATNTGVIPVTGSGTRLMWYPRKAALRAGSAAGTEWDDASIGSGSTAFGDNTMASGFGSMALGVSSSATNATATAIGHKASASGISSFAVGDNVTASGEFSLATGVNTMASGRSSTALGVGTTASGDNSTALGTGASTDGQRGSFVYNDATPGVFTSVAQNEFAVRASGGFRFRTSNNLSTGCDVVAGNLTCTGSISGAGGVGLPTNSSGAFDFSNANGLVAVGATGTGVIPVTGGGTRLMWYPRKAALRAGSAAGTEWDDASIGSGSTAFGDNTMASGFGSMALGLSSSATNATATAIGHKASASGISSFAVGDNVTASGEFALATGANTMASGRSSTALGVSTTASGDNSTALGTNASTDGQRGSFVYNDATPGAFSSAAQNEFAVRASGGFRFRSANDLATGCDLPAGSGTWSCTSSRLAKEGFADLNGDDVLTRIARMPIQSWSYKTEPGVKHVGPTAQDFRAAFGLGTTDQAISLVDIDGINLLGVQALVRRTRTLEQENADLRARVERLEALLTPIKKP